MVYINAYIWAFDGKLVWDKYGLGLIIEKTSKDWVFSDHAGLINTFRMRNSKQQKCSSDPEIHAGWMISVWDWSLFYRLYYLWWCFSLGNPVQTLLLLTFVTDFKILPYRWFRWKRCLTNDIQTFSLLICAIVRFSLNANCFQLFFIKICELKYPLFVLTYMDYTGG